MAVCPICNTPFDERRYQLVVPELGAFDSMACAEEALRRERRRVRVELSDALVEAVQDWRPADIDAPVEGGTVADPPD